MFFCNEKVLPTQTLMHDSICCKRRYSYPLAMGNLNQHNLKCITPNVANDFTLANLQGGSLNNPNFYANLQILQITFLLLINKGRVLPTQTQVHDSKCSKQCFLMPICKGGDLPTQTLMHDIICYKQLFSYPLACGECYPTQSKAHNIKCCK